MAKQKQDVRSGRALSERCTLLLCVETSVRQESHGEDIFLNNGSAGPGGRSIAVTHIRTRTKPLWVTQAFGCEAVPTAYSTEVTRTCLIWMNDGEEALQHLYQVLKMLPGPNTEYDLTLTRSTSLLSIQFSDLVCFCLCRIHICHE